MNEFRDALPIMNGIMAFSPSGGGPCLLAGRCSECRRTFFPKREICPSCFDQGKIEEMILSPRGKLFTFTIVRRGMPNKNLPYALGYIRSRENLIIFASLTDCDLNKITIGMEMEIVFEEEEVERRKCITYKYRPVLREEP